MLYCLLAFILGWMVSKQMGNGFRVGGQRKDNLHLHNSGHRQNPHGFRPVHLPSGGVGWKRVDG